MELKAEHYIGIFIRTRTPIKDGASFSLRIGDKSRLVLRFGFRVVMVIRLRVVVMVRVKFKSCSMLICFRPEIFVHYF